MIYGAAFFLRKLTIDTYVFLSYGNCFEYGGFPEWWSEHFRRYKNQTFCGATIVDSILKDVFKSFRGFYTLGGAITVTFFKKEKKVI